MNQNPWVEMRDGRAPRLWLSLPEGNLLISWETMKKIRAELMQMEMVRKIDGTRLAVKVDEIPE